MRDVFRTVAPGDAFILEVAGNTMPRAKIERIERISELVEERGRYPIMCEEGSRCKGEVYSIAGSFSD